MADTRVFEASSGAAMAPMPQSSSIDPVAQARELYTEWEHDKTGHTDAAREEVREEPQPQEEALQSEIRAAVQRCLQPENLRVAIMEAMRSSDLEGCSHPQAAKSPRLQSCTPGLFSRTAYEVLSNPSADPGSTQSSIPDKWISAGISRARAETARHRSATSPGRTKPLRLTEEQRQGVVARLTRPGSSRGSTPPRRRAATPPRRPTPTRRTAVLKSPRALAIPESPPAVRMEKRQLARSVERLHSSPIRGQRSKLSAGRSVRLGSIFDIVNLSGSRFIPTGVLSLLELKQLLNMYGCRAAVGESVLILSLDKKTSVSRDLFVDSLSDSLQGLEDAAFDSVCAELQLRSCKARAGQARSVAGELAVDDGTTDDMLLHLTLQLLDMDNDGLVHREALLVMLQQPGLLSPGGDHAVNQALQLVAQHNSVTTTNFYSLDQVAEQLAKSVAPQSELVSFINEFPARLLVTLSNLQSYTNPTWGSQSGVKRSPSPVLTRDQEDEVVNRLYRHQQQKDQPEWVMANRCEALTEEVNSVKKLPSINSNSELIMRDTNKGQPFLERMHDDELRRAARQQQVRQAPAVSKEAKPAGPEEPGQLVSEEGPKRPSGVDHLFEWKKQTQLKVAALREAQDKQELSHTSSRPSINKKSEALMKNVAKDKVHGLRTGTRATVHATDELRLTTDESELQDRPTINARSSRLDLGPERVHDRLYTPRRPAPEAAGTDTQRQMFQQLWGN